MSRHGFVAPWVLAVLMLCACGPSETPGDALRIAVIPKGTTHEFWKSIHAGAIKAERELAFRGTDVEIIWQGPIREDDRDTQIQVVENASSRGVDGIVLAPLDSRALVRPVNAAVAANIPVVVIDSALDGDGFVSFVATDNYAGGAEAAHYLVDQLGGRGNVILLRYAVGSASTEAREAGFLDTLAADYPEVHVLSDTEYAGATRDTAYRTSQALLNRFSDQVDGVFAVNESATVGMTLALREFGKAGGAVVMVGFDAGTSSIEDLRNGDVQALVVQDPLRMGFDSVITVVQAIRGEVVPARIDTGVVLVTAENMDDESIQQLLYPPLSEYLD